MEESLCALFMHHLKKTLHMSICANIKALFSPSEAGKGSGAQVLGGAAEETGVV